MVGLVRSEGWFQPGAGVPPSVITAVGTLSTVNNGTSVSHTQGSGADLIVVGFVHGNTSQTATCTYGGQSLTLAAVDSIDAGIRDSGAYIFYGLSGVLAAASGSTVSVSGAGTQPGIWAQTYSGVAQQVPSDTETYAGTSSSSGEQIAATSGDLVVGAAMMRRTFSPSITSWEDVSITFSGSIANAAWVAGQVLPASGTLNCDISGNGDSFSFALATFDAA